MVDANLYTFLNDEALNAKCLCNFNADKHFLVFKSLEYVNANAISFKNYIKSYKAQGDIQIDVIFTLHTPYPFIYVNIAVSINLNKRVSFSLSKALNVTIPT